MKRELKQIGNDLFELTIQDDEAKSTTIKKYSRKELREIHDTLAVQIDQLQQAVNHTKKQMKKSEVTLTEEEEKLLELMEKAASKSEYKKLKMQNEQQEADLNLYKSQMKEIELQLPETVRNK